MYRYYTLILVKVTDKETVTQFIIYGSMIPLTINNCSEFHSHYVFHTLFGQLSKGVFKKYQDWTCIYQERNEQ